MIDLPDHPDISRAERTRYSRNLTVSSPRCPRCGEELTINDDVYTDFTGDIVGCSHCLVCREASEVFDEDE